MPRFYLLNSPLDFLLVDPVPLVNELPVGDYLPFEPLDDVIFVVVEDYQFDGALSEQIDIFCCVLPVFCEDDLRLRVFCNVVAGGQVVGGVDPDRDATGHNAPEKGEEPFWGVETDDVDRGVFRQTVGQ